MKKILNSGLALTLLALGSISACADQLLYIADTNSNLGTVDLTAGSNYGKVTVLGNSGLVLHDIGFTNTGGLYGDTYTAAYSVNAGNGAISQIGSWAHTSISGWMVGLIGDTGAGLIAESSKTNQLYAIDVSPFSIAPLSGTLSGLSAGDATFGLNGELYDIMTNGDLDAVTISGTTIMSTVIGNIAAPGSGQPLITINGMATETNGTVLAISGTQIYTVNLTTAKLTKLLDYSGHGLVGDSGAAILTVPEPTNVALLLAGLAGLVFYQKRRRVVTAQA